VGCYDQHVRREEAVGRSFGCFTVLRGVGFGWRPLVFHDESGGRATVARGWLCYCYHADYWSARFSQHPSPERSSPFGASSLAW
jgi:hypothetical protein